MDREELIARYEKVAIASVADACDAVVGRTCYMSYDMQARTCEKRVVGPAVTVGEAQAVKNFEPKYTIEQVENSKPGDVLVIGMEGDARNMAVLGGLITAGAVAKKMAGAVLDAGVRDVDEIRGYGFPVYARSVSPGTTLGRYTTVTMNEPVICGGVRVCPGDLIVAGTDGVVAVPQEYAEEVLKAAEDIDAKEAEQAKYITETGSLKAGLAKYNRI